MRGKKAKLIRKSVKQLFNLDASHTVYNEWRPPEYKFILNGMFKVARGIPCTLSKTCGRKKYKELKDIYK